LEMLRSFPNFTQSIIPQISITIMRAVRESTAASPSPFWRSSQPGENEDNRLINWMGERRPRRNETKEKTFNERANCEFEG
jgi:hypothetical protein